jgi:hypothetical protein
MNTTFIYSLCDPLSLEVRYVGKSDDPWRRYCRHLVDKEQTHKVAWIQCLLKNGFNPILQILEECDKSVWEERERNWISFEKRCGCDLTNSTLGREGGTLKNTRLGKENPMYGRHLSVEHKQKISLASKGKPHSKEHSRKIGESQKGKIITKQQREKISESLKKKPVRYWLGKKRSQETINKLVASHKGKIPWNKGLKTGVRY